VRRNYVLPALFGSTVFALVPTIFLTTTFAPRWVYLPSLLWAGFLGALTVTAVRWLFARRAVLQAAAVGAALAGLGVLFVPATIDAQSWMPGQARQMREIMQVLERACPTARGTKVFLLPLPVVDPGYAVPSLVHLVLPDATVVPQGNSRAVPKPGDCVIDWRSGHYRATAVDASFVAGPYWGQPVRAPCPQAVPWQEAGGHTGRLIMVTGPVVGIVNPNGGTARLDIGKEAKLLLLVQAQDKTRFSVPLERYLGETVCVTGVVEGIRGIPSIFVETQDAIAVQQSAVGECPDAVPWERAATVAGREATVRGPVIGVGFGEASGSWRLDIGRVGGFRVIIPLRYRQNFPVSPDRAYEDATICVTGTVQQQLGLPFIVVETPEEITYHEAPGVN
jgi:hypothetical protein